MDIDPEIAAAMGFSSFGAQPSAKKRKYTQEDAIVDLPASAPQQKSSGANSTQLGVRPKKQQHQSGSHGDDDHQTPNPHDAEHSNLKEPTPSIPSAPAEDKDSQTPAP